MNKAAILGGGQIGTRHAHNFARLGYGVQVYDVEPTRGTVKTAAEALEGADLAVIATPPLEHAQGVLDALNAGVQWVLVEKPLAVSLREADALREIAPTFGAHVYVGYCLRFALATLELPQAIEAIKPIRLIEAVYSERGPLERQPWLQDPKQGGVVLEHSHILDVILRTLGIPEFIAGAVERDRVAALLQWYDDDFAGTLRMDFWGQHETRLKVIGERGEIEWRREQLIAEPSTPQEHPAAWLLHEAQELHTLRMTGETSSPRGATPLCTLDEAIRVLEFAERLR